MSEANGIQVAEVVAQQLESLLEAGNYDSAKLLLGPVQEVDAAEAIDVVEAVEVATPEGLRFVPRDELGFSYRTCRLPPRAVVTRVAFRLRRGDVAAKECSIRNLAARSKTARSLSKLTPRPSHYTRTGVGCKSSGSPSGRCNQVFGSGG